jgi:hypothetical protein
VGPSAGLDDVEKRKFLTLPGQELRPLRRPAHSQSLYRLRYPGCLRLHGVVLNQLSTGTTLPLPRTTSHIPLDQASDLFLLDFPTTTLCAFCTCPCVPLLIAFLLISAT